MSLVVGGLVASHMEAAAMKQIDGAARVARKTMQGIKGIKLITDVNERGVEPGDILRGSTIAKRLDVVDSAMDFMESDMLDGFNELDGTEIPDLENPDYPDYAELNAETDAADNSLDLEADGIDSARTQLRNSFLAKRERMTKAERSPGKMAREAAERIAEISPSQEEWKLMAPAERLTTLKRCFAVLGEEACLPQDLIERTEIGMEEMRDANALAVFFINEDSPGTWFTSLEKPYIAFATGNLENPDYTFDECVSTLYHETMHVLQQQCLLEAGDTAPYKELKEEWAAAIRSRMNKTDGYDERINYLSNSLEIFAIQQKELFRLMLDCYKYGMR